MAVPIEIARGIAICGKNDQFSRIEGRKLAISRARHALYGKESNGPICDGGSSNRFFDCLTEQFPECNETMFEGEFTMSSEAFAELASARRERLPFTWRRFLLLAPQRKPKKRTCSKRQSKFVKLPRQPRQPRQPKLLSRKQRQRRK